MSASDWLISAPCPSLIIAMQLQALLTPRRCYCRMNWSSKKRVLTGICELLGKQDSALASAKIYPALMAREQLGSTGLGNGTAIPHCRVPHCQQPIGSLITLQQPVDYDAVDDQPVDLLFVMLVPPQQSEQHVRTLAGVAAMFNDEDLCTALRAATEPHDLYRIALGCVAAWQA